MSEVDESDHKVEGKNYSSKDGKTSDEVEECIEQPEKEKRSLMKEELKGCIILDG